ncbi:phage tail assembly chaperone [Longirhabdus pacifica]|uniref:phage tail assembly chaperone n=1 Tax=Longirhabdus pacifica TaxID=2305227 RepID=UPI0013E8E6D2|nr:hypothetical protein [Longirhabdus pacifica]
MTKTTKSTKGQNILQALLDAEVKPQAQVYMKRFDVHFVIEALDGKMINRIREQASYPVKGGKELDEEKFGSLMIEKACIEPKWSDPKLIEAFGPTAVDVIGQRLLAGEIAKLTTEILNLSGFGDEEEQINEIKN